MSDYVPIPCIEHERLEFAVLRRQRLDLTWRDANGVEHRDSVLPVDVATRDGAEWLSLRGEDGALTRLRLDRIVVFAPV
jgi:Rho-binding antiterminator